MGKIYVVANWKARKTVTEAREWLQEIFNFQFSIFNYLEVIICAPFIHLPILKEELLNPKPYTLIPKLGAQDISLFEDGPYTGEVTGRMLEDLVDYVIIGHSERRKYFGETNEVVVKKVERAFKYNLTPIICTSEINQVEALKELSIVTFRQKTCSKQACQLLILYEPLFAIGSGQPDTPENANLMAGKIKNILGDAPVLYGGSVSAENVKSFLCQPQISGVGVGKESLEPASFLEILKNATQTSP